jgi:hypothetical protein
LDIKVATVGLPGGILAEIGASVSVGGEPESDLSSSGELAFVVVLMLDMREIKAVIAACAACCPPARTREKKTGGWTRGSRCSGSLHHVTGFYTCSATFDDPPSPTRHYNEFAQ